MNVQVYEYTGNTECTEAEEVERRELVTELGLDITQQEEVISFPELSEVEKRVYTILCPYMESVEKYTGYIPTRVLRLVKNYKGHFSKLEIWTDKQQDPLLIGITGSTTFLLARWGDVLEEFSILKDRAILQYKTKRKAKLESKLHSVESDTMEYFLGGYVSDIY